MDWLLHNPVADMYGPRFLLFYAAVALATLVACWLVVKLSDWTRLMPTPAVPPTPDPYEIAYLRDGEDGVGTAALFGLVQRGYLETIEQPDGAVIRRAAGHPDPRLLTQLERRLFESFKEPRKPLNRFGRLDVVEEIKGGCQEYERKLRREHLLAPPDARRTASVALYGGLLVILGLGGYKLAVALWKGYTNVWFLVGIALFSSVVLGMVCQKPYARLSRRGEAYLKKLQAAFEQLKHRQRTATDAQPLAHAAFDPSMLLLVGLFGHYVLAGTAHEQYYRTLYASQPSSSSGTDGGGDGGSSSSDSGGGGSCGGGGCGGGGCGGCGGD